MGSRPARHHYCRCGTHLAADNAERQCARCQRASRDKLIAPPHVPDEFWHTEQLREAFAAQHIGRVARAYRTHPYHYAVYGPDGISKPCSASGWVCANLKSAESRPAHPSVTWTPWPTGREYCGYRPSYYGSTCQVIGDRRQKTIVR